MAVCSSCGCDLPEGRSFCPRCGAPAPQSSAPPAVQARENGYASPAYDYRDPVRAPEGPMSVTAYLGSIVLMSLPIVGLVMKIVWSLSSKNRNRRNLAIAYLILTIIAWLLVFAGGFMLAQWFEGLGDIDLGALLTDWLAQYMI